MKTIFSIFNVKIPVCQILEDGVNFFLDLSFSKRSEIMEISKYIPTFQVKPYIYPFLENLSSFIVKKQGKEVAIIVENENVLDSIYYKILEGYELKVVLLTAQGDLDNKIDLLRPVPEYFAVIGDTEDIESIVGKVFFCSICTLKNVFLFSDSSTLRLHQMDLCILRSKLRPSSVAHKL